MTLIVPWLYTARRDWRTLRTFAPPACRLELAWFSAADVMAMVTTSRGDRVEWVTADVLRRDRGSTTQSRRAWR